MTVDPIEFRRTLALFPTGVTVVGTRHVPDGVCGLTANAFTSVSLEPPLVLVCLDRSSNTHACIERRGFFSVNVLSAGQDDLAVRFARKGDDKFDGVPHVVGDSGAPLLEGAVAWLECRVEETLAGGDHTVFLARVEQLSGPEAGNGTGPPPLVFHRGSYSSLPLA